MMMVGCIAASSAPHPIPARDRTSPWVAGGIAIASLLAGGTPARADVQPGLDGPAAPTVRQFLTTSRSLGCLSPDGVAIGCQLRNNGMLPHPYYGNAVGTGPGTDVIAIVFYQPDPTGNGTAVSVTYFHRQGRAYRLTQTFPQVHFSVLAPNTTVEFLSGHARFTAITSRPGDSRCCPTGRTRYLLSLR